MNIYSIEETLRMFLPTAGTAIVLILMRAVGLFLVGFAGIRIILKIVRKILEKSNLDKALYAFIINGLKAVLWVMVIISILGVLGIPTSTFVAVLGAVGAAIALALKDSLGNVSGGIIIIMTKPFKNGDFIDVAGCNGIVERTDLLYTYLRTFDNKVISIPNGNLTTSVLTNYSRLDTRRVDCRFGVGYEADLTKVKEVLMAVTKENTEILSEPAPFFGVAGHGESCIDIDFRVWCQTDEYWNVKYFLEENVKIAFDNNGISIPYPQIDVHNVK